MGELVKRIKITLSIWGLRARSWVRIVTAAVGMGAMLYAAYDYFLWRVAVQAAGAVPAVPVGLNQGQALVLFAAGAALAKIAL